MDKVIGGQLASESLVERGVEYIFTISGGHITPIYQFLENSKVKLFSTRHEQVAVFMAEAWARMTRKPAVAMVTAGGPDLPTHCLALPAPGFPTRR